MRRFPWSLADDLRAGSGSRGPLMVSGKTGGAFWLHLDAGGRSMSGRREGLPGSADDLRQVASCQGIPLPWEGRQGFPRSVPGGVRCRCCRCPWWGPLRRSARAASCPAWAGPGCLARWARWEAGRGVVPGGAVDMVGMWAGAAWVSGRGLVGCGLMGPGAVGPSLVGPGPLWAAQKSGRGCGCGAGGLVRL